MEPQYTTTDRVLSSLKLETADRATIDRIAYEIVMATDTAIQIMLFAFGGDTVVAVLDGPGDTMLYLPAPGALTVNSVSENGVTLDQVLYVVEARMGRYVMRLDANGVPTWWTASPRGITVTFTPNPHPPAVEQVVIRETVRAWNAHEAGYPEVVGVQGSNARAVGQSFSEESVRTLERIAARYNIRDTIAI
jgi:hypothetical protein